MRPGTPRILTVLSATAVALHSLAQDPQLTQFYAAPMYLNPALTGNTDQDRIALNYRLQWPGIGPGYRTYAAAYDHHSANLSSGFGGMVLHDRAGSAGLAFTQASFCYSYEARINRKRAVRAGLKAGYTTRTFNWGDVVFADQIIRENATTSVEQAMMQSISYFDFSGGLMYYTEQFWGGISVNHLNRPQQSLYLSGDARLPIRTSIDAGYKFPLDGKPFRHSETMMTLAAHYKAQQKCDQLDLGGYVDYKDVIFGMWYRGLPALKAYQPGYSNDDALILMAGYSTPYRLRMVYSYDITISKLTAKSGGAHEISLVYEWAQTGKNRKYRSVPCPKF